MYFLVHKVIRNRSIWGPCQFLILSPNTLWKTSLSIISRPLLTFPHPTILLSWIRFERGNLPFLWWNPVSPPCTCVCNLISRNGLNQYCSIQTISHGSPPLVGVPFAVDFLFSTQSNEKSVNLGTLQIFNFCHQTPCENLFCFSSSYYLASWIRSERGNLPFLWWNPVSPPYSMYVRLQPNFPKWFESALPNLDQFTWISTIRGGYPLR